MALEISEELSFYYSEFDGFHLLSEDGTSLGVTDIASLHDVQNLYYALKGEELDCSSVIVEAV